jgi:hypothetical protein
MESKSSFSIGVGKSIGREAFQAGRDAVRQALDRSRKQEADLVLLFATAGYDQQKVVDGAKEAAKNALIAGCSVSGVITREGSDEGTHVVSAMAIQSSSLQFETYQVSGFSKDSWGCGRELARHLESRKYDPGRLLLLFPDGVRGNVSQMLTALESHLPYPLLIAGGTASELLKLRRTWQYHEGRAVSDAVSAVLVKGDFEVDVAVSHACASIGIEQTVTRAEGGWIYEIDGKPAWSVFQEYLDVRDLNELDVSHICYICLAEKLPHPDPVYGPEIIRCPLQLDKKSGALFFPGSIATGARVKMALRNEEKAIERALSSTRQMISRHSEVDPFMILQFDCCCRARLLFGDCTTEVMIRPLQNLFNPDIPWMGINSYGEIAPLIQGMPYFHNYSMVLCALYPRR